MTIKVIVTQAKFARDNEHFAFVGRYWRSSQDKPIDLSLGLYYAELVPKLSIYMVIDPHIGRVRKTDELISAGQLSWAPDGKRFTYSWGHKVWVYSIRSRTASVISEGETPNWSPDGRFISFRTLDGFAVLIDPDDGKQISIMKGRKIDSGLRWSPDSKYLLFSEDSHRPQPLFYNRDFLVYRLQDGAVTIVANLPSMSADMFFWIPCSHGKSGTGPRQASISRTAADPLDVKK